MLKKMPLHIKIVLGMVLGVVFGIIAMQIGTPDANILEANRLNKEIVSNTKKQITDLNNQLNNITFSSESNASSINQLIKREELKQQKEILSQKLVLDKKKVKQLKSKGQTFIEKWVKPWGSIFINLLKLIAIPLIIASLIKGVSDLKDISKFKKIGLRSILIYIGTTVVAISIGLLVVNVVQPGEGISQDTIDQLTSSYEGNSKIASRIAEANNQQSTGPLQFLVDMVPSNIFGALSSNGNMLQVIFFAIFFGISMLLIPAANAKPIKDFFDGLNDIVLKMVDLIMLAAPLAVFALMANVVASAESWEVIYALIKYSLTVIGGLALMVTFYCLLVGLVVKKNPFWFLKQLAPAQLLAFTTSSSAATLPVTMERVEEHLGVDKEVSSFVLPVGATINMDGTSLYQAVAAVFIAQALSVGLDFSDQLTIILTALMASIGSAAVPGAGMVMLVIVLQSVGKFSAAQIEVGLTLIFAVDRILDMCRTTINVTGDATVSMIVAKSVGKLHTPKPKNWDDNLENI